MSFLIKKPKDSPKPFVPSYPRIRCIFLTVSRVTALLAVQQPSP